MVSHLHIHFLVSAGLHLPGRLHDVLRWQARRFTPEELAASHESGRAWGPDAEANYRKVMRQLTPDSAGRVGAMLLAENARSVNHRYAAEDWEAPYLFESTAPPRPLAVLKALDYYEYHACEHPQWEESEAAHFCEALRRHAVQALPGYDAAPWGIDDAHDLQQATGRR
ncbi:hypothetical protein [Streptacidiphilus sp. EB103A]|uniref:hypothetical protein n=1 Tax=Streptacidiphilus sp. EB103A TaxID=3156275 RepID=UPI003515920D